MSGTGDQFVSAAFNKPNADTEAVLQQMVNETNSQFNNLGISMNFTKSVPSGPAPTCANCQKPIQGRVLEAMSQTWHPDCFQCSQCGNTIDVTAGTFLVSNNQPWCKKCADWDRKEKLGKFESKGSTGTSTSSVTAGSTSSISSSPSAAPSSQAAASTAAQQQAHANIQAGKAICAGCGGVITTSGVTYQDLLLHDTCFLCAGCRKPIDTTLPFVEHEDLPYHSDCHLQLNAKKCGICKKPIVGAYISTGGQTYHKSCFTCSKCKAPFSGSYMQHEDQNLCPKCFSSVTAAMGIPGPSSSTTSTTAVSTTAIPGIRYDHITQQVRQVGTNAAVSSSSSTAAIPPASSSSSTSTPATSGGRKFCGNCGTKLEAVWKFCGSCGEKV